jgi:hypothetical protein
MKNNLVWLSKYGKKLIDQYNIYIVYISNHI